MSKKYIPRLFDLIIEFSLKSKGAVVIVRPKWCGKSTTAARYAKTLIDLMPLENRVVTDDIFSLKDIPLRRATRHFIDPSIGAAALGITPEGIFRDITTFGFLFESVLARK